MSESSANPPPRHRLSGLKPEALMAQGMRGPEIAVEVPGFEIETMLGRGGMGAVFLARQISLDREVAVKVLAHDVAGDPLFLDRLEREARLMARLRHPNIVAVHDFQRTIDGAAIVMEFVEGGSLREKLLQHPNGLPVEDALRLISQIAAGLEVAHASGVVHRDMKPENVLLDSDGTARVTDFGLALPLHEGSARLTLTGATAGTIDYMAPEQIKGGEMDARLDIYALGVVAYELLTGRTPRGSFDPPHQLRPEIRPHVGMAVMRALRPDLAERFNTTGDFVRALHAPPANRHLRWPWVLGLAALLAVGVVSWFPQDEASSAAVASPQPGPWRDGLAKVKLPEAALVGAWRQENGGFVSDDQICVLALEPEMPQSYDVRVGFTRLSGADSVAVFIWVNACLGSCEFDAWRLGLSGMQLINGKSLEEGESFRFPLENGRRYQLLVEVRPASVRIMVDGRELKHYKLGGQDSLWPPSPWTWNAVEKPAQLALGSWRSPTLFDHVEWRMVPLGVK